MSDLRTSQSDDVYTPIVSSPCDGNVSQAMDRVSAYWHLRHNLIERISTSLGGMFPTQERKCEHMGHIVIGRMQTTDLTLTEVVNAILEFVHYRGKQDTRRHFCWLVLHLGLGICYRERQVAKDLPRQLLYELLYFSRGVDFGIFLRDSFEVNEHRGVPEKTVYLLSVCAGFKVDLAERKLFECMFVGHQSAIWGDLLDGNSCCYLDLPISHPTLPADVDVSRFHLRASPLLLCIVNMKPKAVLLLLRHGATPSGPLMDYIFGMFHNLLDYQSTGLAETILKMGVAATLRESLVYCLRSMRHLNLSCETRRSSDKRVRNVYHVNKEVMFYIPAFFSRPCSLQHLVRCYIRDELMFLDRIPSAIRELDIPTSLQDYLDLLR